MKNSFPRKVVLIGSAWPLRGGGISTFNERLALAYQELGCEVIIYSFRVQYPSIFFPGTSQYTNEPPPDKLNIKSVINSVNPLNWILTAYRILHENADLVIVRFWIPFMAPSLGTIARVIRLKSRVKVIAITDNIVPHEPRIGDKLLVRYFVNSVDGFLAMSESVLTDLKKFDLKKPKIFHPHPLYDNFGACIPKSEACRRLALNENERYILFFGFIRDYKGLDLLLHAMNTTQIRKLGIKLLIAGEFYGNEEKYHSLIKELDVGDNLVLRTNFIPNSEVCLYFCSSDLVVQPYKHATQSGVTQIAYHFNKPMITTNVGGLSEMIPDGKVGYVVDPEPHQISNSIVKYFSENRESQFVNNIQEEKKRFSWAGLISAINNLLTL